VHAFDFSYLKHKKERRRRRIILQELYEPVVIYHLMLDKISFKLGISMGILI
jgi:hypothetical protein